MATMIENGLRLNCTGADVDWAVQRFKDGWIEKPTEHLRITENTKETMGILDYATLEVDVQPNLQQELNITPSKDIQEYHPNNEIQGFKNVKVDAIPSNYTDTSEATADKYDIFNEKTAFVNGQLVTGKYRAMRYGMAESTVAEGCSWSTTQVRLACEFEPTCMAVVFNSGSYANNRVIAAWAMDTSAIVYHTKTSSGIARTQITSNVSSYWYYDSVNKQVVINSPTTSYLWSNNAYRYFLFK